MRIYIIIVLLVIALFVLQGRLWFETGGILDMLKQKHLLTVQNKEIEDSKKQNEKLLFQVQRLRHSQEETENLARNELGMIKKDEVFYQIVKRN